MIGNFEGVRIAIENLVLDYLKSKGKSTIKNIVKGTSVELHKVEKVIEIMVEDGRVQYAQEGDYELYFTEEKQEINEKIKKRVERSWVSNDPDEVKKRIMGYLTEKKVPQNAYRIRLAAGGDYDSIKKGLKELAKEKRIKKIATDGKRFKYVVLEDDIESEGNPEETETKKEIETIEAEIKELKEKKKKVEEIEEKLNHKVPEIRAMGAVLDFKAAVGIVIEIVKSAQGAKNASLEDIMKHSKDIYLLTTKGEKIEDTGN